MRFKRRTPVKRTQGESLGKEKRHRKEERGKVRELSVTIEGRQEEKKVRKGRQKWRKGNLKKELMR